MSKTRTPLQAHRSGECGCSVLVNPNHCIYQPFLDGWDFTPDVGNGQVRGEIFTPRFVVDKMIADVGMLPREAVYDYNYHVADGRKLTKAQTLAFITNKINEPALGTANFTATILWHKLEYAAALATTVNRENNSSHLNQQAYEYYATLAVASMYANDIDPGNAQTTKWRLLRSSEISTPQNMEFWAQHIASYYDPKTFGTGKRKTDKQKERWGRLMSQVQNSILLASINWGTADQDKGVLDVQYQKHTGFAPSPELIHLWKSILDENIKLFNGIVEKNTTTHGEEFVAGWQHVWWRDWKFKQAKHEGEIPTIIEPPIMVSLAKQIHEGRLNRLKTELEQLEMKKTVPTNSLINKPDFDDPADKKAYLAKRKELEREQKMVLPELFIKQPEIKTPEPETPRNQPTLF